MQDKRYYSAEELTVSAYAGIAGSGDLAKLRRRSLAGSREADAKAWAAVQDAITEITGINTDYVDYCRARIKELEALEKYARGDRFALNLARRHGDTARSLSPQGKNDILAYVPQLSKWAGFYTDPQKVTIAQYYRFIKAYNESQTDGKS